MIFFSSPAMIALRPESTNVGRPVCPEISFKRYLTDLSLETFRRT
jgi:hypothetical protein